MRQRFLSFCIYIKISTEPLANITYYFLYSRIHSLAPANFRAEKGKMNARSPRPERLVTRRLDRARS